MANETKAEGAIWRVKNDLPGGVITPEAIEFSLESVYLPTLTSRSIIPFKVYMAIALSSFAMSRITC